MKPTALTAGIRTVHGHRLHVSAGNACGSVKYSVGGVFWGAGHRCSKHTGHDGPHADCCGTWTDDEEDTWRGPRWQVANQDGGGQG